MYVGSTMGNIMGTLYLLAYQALGIMIAFRIIKNDKMVFRILVGSVLGSIGLHWCPILFSFMFDFTVVSHVSGLVLFVLITLMVYMIVKKKENKNLSDSIKNYPVLFVAAPLFILFCMMLWNHTLVLNDSGGYSTGQCGFGDMNMHLGFITSIANQHTFPPHYSIFPDAKLSYPFLSDTISSSIYIWGASLRYAYMLPMWIAILQVMCGMYLFAESWLKDRWKAFLAYVLFFFNGGFGIIYFLNGYKTFDDLMHGFYNTPTNLVDVNVRWTNTIVDMLLPQRATLFGWAILFTVLCVLRNAWENRRKDFFILAGIMSGALPMVHTHSFLALGIICFGWLIGDIARRVGIFAWGGKDDVTKKKEKIILCGMCAFGLILFSILSAVQNSSEQGLPDKFYMALGIVGIFIIFCMGIYLFFKMQKKDRSDIIRLWGVFLVMVVIFAFPQLFYWTFGQVASGGMLHGHFNWSNSGDIAEPYIMYYLKNIGLVAILFVPAWIFAKKRDIAHVFPSLIIWFLCELMVFQPNVYDNNKLLLVAYMLICCLVACAVCDWIRRGFKKTMVSCVIKYAVVVILIVVCTVSGLLTMVREQYSGTKGANYELYNKELLDACTFIEENTPANSVILTANNHNNAVASLTGRNIVCGSSTFLYFHGFDTYNRELDIAEMYSDPVSSADLYNYYDVDFVLVSHEEYNAFENIDEQAIYDTFNCVYSTENVRIYQVR